MEHIFIGVAWPYANASATIGGLAGVYLPADVFARFHRLRGDDVLMVSGSDMHGTPILVTAEQEGSTPADVSARFDAEHRRVFEQLGISFDLYTSTHTLVHERTVQEVFLRLLENGYIGRKTEENAYCPKHQRFLPDRYVVGTCPHCGSPTARGDECDRCGRILEVRQLGEPKCRLCGTPAEFRASEHFYLLLDALAPKLEAFVSDKPHWRDNVTGITRNFLNVGLHPTAITRDLDWGVPIPLEGYPTKRFYVWFDAVIGYLSASREWAIRSGHPDAWERFWTPSSDARAYYFLGKDNIFFHTVTWPAILLGHGGLRLPYDVPANEWLQIGGRKISKTRPEDANATLQSLLKHYAPDLIRFYVALLAPQNHDTEFDWDEFHQVADEVLANQYGNLAQRLLVLTRERHHGRVPVPPPGGIPPGTGGVGDRIRAAHAAITADLAAVRLKEAFDRILTEVRDANKWVHDAQPWAAAEPERARILYEGLWRLKAISIWLAPYLPFSSAEVYRMLGYPAAPSAGDWDQALVPVAEGQPLGEIRPLFPRRDVAAAGATGPVVASSGPGSAPSPVPSAAGDRPAPLDVRIGVVRSAENHPSADRLYVLQIDLGEPKVRTVVAGMRPSYTIEEMQGRRVAVLTNLAPRTIRKVTSQGMVLAADAGEKAVLVRPPPDLPVGTRLEGTPPDAPIIDYAEFERTPLVTGRVSAIAGDGSAIDVGDRSVTVPGHWVAGTEVIVRLRSVGASEGDLLAFGRQAPADTAAVVPPGTKVK